MEFEWDDEKNSTNIQKHHLSFEEAIEIFTHPTFTTIDKRNNYREIRKISIGKIQNILVIVVVHTKRHQNIRIISARLANRKERRKYHEHLKKKA